MIENQFHANIVLSNDQCKSLSSIHPMYRVPKEIGVITFLGVGESFNRDTVHLLIRFEPFAALEMAMIESVIGRVFGESYEKVLRNPGALYSVIIKTMLQSPLRNPKQFIRKRAETFAKEIVKWRLEQIRAHKEDEERDWQAMRFDMPEWV